MDGSCVYEGRRIAYRVHGTGPRVIVLTHGLLMDGRMYTKLAPALVARAYRLVTIDVLGHGFSDQPHDMASYSMTQFGRDVVAVLDHLGIEQAVVGGTSLGANISLEVAVAAPDRVRGLVLEMPVLENGLAAAAAAFVPLALALRVSLPAMRVVSSLMRRIPRTTFMVDLMLDFVRRDPAASLAVLDGVTFGRVAPPGSERRRIQHPTLLVGHRRDPIHPFDDADVLTRDLPRARLVEARSILEWRLSPARLDCELCAFLDEVWASDAGEAQHTHAA
ncbi:MAG: alpha/beta hydrolase [Deltaproteobacteria bacterium]|nr:alpha/beta hydrolase [Deltaproteobacteria bacterium]